MTPSDLLSISHRLTSVAVHLRMHQMDNTKAALLRAIEALADTFMALAVAKVPPRGTSGAIQVTVET